MNTRHHTTDLSHLRAFLNFCIGNRGRKKGNCSTEKRYPVAAMSQSKTAVSASLMNTFSLQM